MTTKAQQSDLQVWKAVPRLVAYRMKYARELFHVYSPVVDSATWCPSSNTLYVQAEDPLVVPRRYLNTVCQFVQDTGDVYQTKQAVLLKAAEEPKRWDIPISTAFAPHRAVGSVIGASPFANALTSGLIGGGVGYGVGHLLSHFFPDEYVNRKGTRRWSAALGALAGAGLHAPEWMANMRYNHAAKGNSQPFRSLFSAPKDVYNPSDLTTYDVRSGQKPPPPPVTKEGNDSFSNAIVPFKPIPVENFMRTIWRDAGYNQFDTPPPVAAAATGLLTGVQNMFGTPKVTPFSIAQGLMVAGKDMATAKLVGGTLGAMGILTPKAQDALQRAGVWSGLLRGIMTAAF